MKKSLFFLASVCVFLSSHAMQKNAQSYSANTPYNHQLIETLEKLDGEKFLISAVNDSILNHLDAKRNRRLIELLKAKGTLELIALIEKRVASK